MKPTDAELSQAHDAAVEASNADPSDDWAAAARDVLAWVLGYSERPDIEGE